MNRTKFKEAISQLDSPQRTALLYLEDLINSKHISAINAANSIKTPKINTDNIESKILSNTQKIMSLMNKYTQSSKNEKTMLDKTKEFTNILSCLEDILQEHITNVNVATDGTRQLITKFSDMVAYAYSKSRDFGEINSIGKIAKPILTGEINYSDGFPNTTLLLEQISQLKQTIENLGVQLKPDKESRDYTEKR